MHRFSEGSIFNNFSQLRGNHRTHPKSEKCVYERLEIFELRAENALEFPTGNRNIRISGGAY